MSKFFTSTGDDGFTGLLGEGRVPKYHPRTEAVGALDETSAVLGVARSFCSDVRTAPLIVAIQRDLYHIMAEVSAKPENASTFRVINAAKVNWLEDQIKFLTGSIDMPSEFIIPGDTHASAFLAQARTVVRRAERSVAHLFHEKEIENGELLRYLNRLSSLCFVLELVEIQASDGLLTLAKGT